MSVNKYLMAGAALCLFAGLAPQPAQAQRGERILRIFGEDKCPADTICVVAPENERYRIPKELREVTPGPEDVSWAQRAQSMQYVGRTGTQSCSPVGAGGWTGCYQKLAEEARAERRQAAENEPVIP